MNNPAIAMASQRQTTILAANKVIRSTYILLSMTLLFSALTAGISMAFKLPHPGLLLKLGGYFGLLFATTNFLALSVTNKVLSNTMRILT